LGGSLKSIGEYFTPRIQLWRLIMAIEASPVFLRGFDKLEDHGQCGDLRYPFRIEPASAENSPISIPTASKLSFARHAVNLKRFSRESATRLLRTTASLLWWIFVTRNNDGGGNALRAVKGFDSLLGCSGHDLCGAVTRYGKT
jgi:hypothetical protein